MITLKGKGVCSGIAIGRISYFDKSALNVKRISVEDTDAELDRVEAAKNTARNQLSELYVKALREVGEDNANIFEIHRAMLDDFDYNNAITSIITTQKVNAEYAVAVAADNFVMMLSSMSDDYMRARSADVRDISDRIIRCLNGCIENISDSGERIVCAFDLAPSATVQMDKKGLLAFVTAAGSSTSHTAILAKTLGIPAVVGVGRKLTSDCNGEIAAVDGTAGIIYINPDEKTIADLKEKQRAEQRRCMLVKEHKGRATATRDGKKISLYANIG
ncbi:MAG: phosphoenolpyruvate--protein phosphotransferase, partial [Oscillospiraceae bacterium]|nr:phosphoenolpyruvate--protein phosphotransferase [Oscillospiraceae bacterium]